MAKTETVKVNPHHLIPDLMDANGTMERLRGGKWYSTAKASLVESKMTGNPGSYKDGEPGDGDFMEERLYLSADGDYFLVGRCGWKGKRAAKMIPDGQRAGCKYLVPLTHEEAHKWRLS